MTTLEITLILISTATSIGLFTSLLIVGRKKMLSGKSKESYENSLKEITQLEAELEKTNEINGLKITSLEKEVENSNIIYSKMSDEFEKISQQALLKSSKS